MTAFVKKTLLGYLIKGLQFSIKFVCFTVTVFSGE